MWDRKARAGEQSSVKAELLDEAHELQPVHVLRLQDLLLKIIFRTRALGQGHAEDVETPLERNHHLRHVAPGSDLEQRDPLEELLYASSVGLPSTHVYESVKDARAARARRLGALQRKLPGVQFALLYTLGGGILASFVLAVAGYAPGVSVVFEAHGFGALTFALVACLRVLRDIWDPTSGAYSVSAVLETMTEGLEDELDALLAGSSESESEAALAYGVI